MSNLLKNCYKSNWYIRIVEIARSGAMDKKILQEKEVTSLNN